jgi:hypothetical protein
MMKPSEYFKMAAEEIVAVGGMSLDRQLKLEARILALLKAAEDYHDGKGNKEDILEAAYALFDAEKL